MLCWQNIYFSDCNFLCDPTILIEFYVYIITFNSNE